MHLKYGLTTDFHMMNLNYLFQNIGLPVQFMESEIQAFFQILQYPE